MALSSSRKFLYQVLFIFIAMLILFIVQQYLAREKKILLDEALTGLLEVNEIWLPDTNDSHQKIKRLRYTLSYNEEAEQANWVAYQLSADDIYEGKAKREDDFREDPQVRTGSASLDDYYRSGYDRGHLAPAADMKRSKKTMSESFYLSNITPQQHDFNAGVWLRLEEQVREWAKQEGFIYVVTGPVLEEGLPTIGKNKVAIPSYYYKVIIDVSLPEGKGIGFLMKNTPSDLPLSRFAVTIDSVESLTGIDFFPLLPDSLENDLEGLVYPRAWGL